MCGSTKIRFLIRLCVVGAGLSPMLCVALGLSELQVDSRLNQQLRARIEVTDVTDEEWRRMRARLHRENSLENPLLHPELLDSVTLRATEDGNHRYFIEVQSSAVLTEPMFDLPIEIAGPTARVIRSYSVLLDPPAADEAQTSTVAPTPVVAPTASKAVAQANQSVSTHRPSTVDQQPAAVYIVKKSDTLERIARHLGGRNAAQRTQLMEWVFEHNPTAFYGDRHHLHTGARLTVPNQPHANVSDAAAPAPHETSSSSAQDAPKTNPAQEQLKDQLTVLQQTLTQMQETIAAQNSQIGKLTAKIAARARSEAAAAAAQAAAAQEQENAEEAEAPARHRGSYLWIGGIGLAILVAAGSAALLRWRNRTRARLAAWKKPAAADSDASSKSKDSEEREKYGWDNETWSKSSRLPALRDHDLWLSKPQSPTPAAQSQAPSQSRPEAALWPPVPQQSRSQPERQPQSQGQSQAPGEAEQQTLPSWSQSQPPGQSHAPSPSQSAPSLTEQLPPAYLDDLPESYTANLAQIPAFDNETDLLPQVTFIENPAEPQASQTSGPSATTLEASALIVENGRSLINKEVAQILEASLGNDPHRVDVRIKLLEIYHHEVHGNRAEFNAMISKLIADPKMLTPAQRAHIEKLQRSLSDETPDAASEFVSKVAI